MPLTLMYITNRPDVAVIAETNGVQWIFIDLELMGKATRQANMDTVISGHRFQDVKRVKDALHTSQLLVRINPIYKGTTEEINRVIDDGADILMLPYFTTAHEVATFINCINGRAKTCLLFETPGAVTNIDSILEVTGIDYIHIGLNDLHLGYGMQFMFELLTNGMVEKLLLKFRSKNIPCGFGGIARLGVGALPAENVIAEHYRLGSQMAILSRSFCNYDLCENLMQLKHTFIKGMAELRAYENWLQNQNEQWFKQNQLITKEIVDRLIQKVRIPD